MEADGGESSEHGLHPAGVSAHLLSTFSGILRSCASAGDPALRTALRKLVRALPAPFRADAEGAADAVVVDPARWGATGPGRSGPVAALQDAVVARRRVSLTYVDRHGTPSERRVDPWGLVDKDGVWYLVAGTGSGRRTFRMDRISAARVTDEPAERPDDLDLGREWEQVVEEVERYRSPVTATVRIDARFLPVLRAQFGRHCEVLDELPGDGRGPRVRVAAPYPVTIAEQLAGWGHRVVVEEPGEVRAELARIGAELVASYPARTGPGC